MADSNSESKEQVGEGRENTEGRLGVQENRVGVF
jgi:hypothetical protein